MARLPQPEFALGLLLRTIRPSLSLDVKGDRGFVLDFFDRACDEKLLPGRLPESECSKNTIPAGWLRGIDRRDLNKIWNGKRPLPEDTARRILPAISEQRIISLWRDTSTGDAIRDLALKLRKDGLQINKPIDVPKAVYVLIKKSSNQTLREMTSCGTKAATRKSSSPAYRPTRYLPAVFPAIRSRSGPRASQFLQLRPSLRS